MAVALYLSKVSGEVLTLLSHVLFGSIRKVIRCCLIPGLHKQSLSFMHLPISTRDSRFDSLCSLSYFLLPCIWCPALLVFLFMIRSQSSTGMNCSDPTNDKIANTVKFDRGYWGEILSEGNQHKVERENVLSISSMLLSSVKRVGAWLSCVPCFSWMTFCSSGPTGGKHPPDWGALNLNTLKPKCSLIRSWL